MAHPLVDPEYKINIYLDTNILVDYICGTFPSLNLSIDYLSKKDIVNLKSSHFILYEYTEVRKYMLFKECLMRDGYLACEEEEEKKTTKAHVKSKNWTIKGKDYLDYAEEINNKVNSELDFLREQLTLNFDENVLHEGLVKPSNELCLSTKISKEDCLVMVSCVYPNTDIKLTQCLILSRDYQYYKAFKEDINTTNAFFERHELFTPNLLNTERLINNSGGMLNLYNPDSEDENSIKEFWDEILREQIKTNFGEKYIGETYEFGKKRPESECIYIEMKSVSTPIRQSEGLFFLSRDLTKRYSVLGPFEYWNNGHPVDSYPFENPEFPKFSFKASEKISPMELEELRKKGLLVFYDDI